MQFWMDTYTASIRSGSLGSRAKIEADKAMTNWKNEFVICGDGKKAEHEPMQATETGVTNVAIMASLKKTDQERILRMGGLAILVADDVITANRAREIGEMSVRDQHYYLKSVLQPDEPDRDVTVASDTDSPDADGMPHSLQTFGAVWARQVAKSTKLEKIIEGWAKTGKACLRFGREVANLERQLKEVEQLLKLADRMGREGDALASYVAMSGAEESAYGAWNKASDDYGDARKNGREKAGKKKA